MAKPPQFTSFLLALPSALRSTLFPYTTLFRSDDQKSQTATTWRSVAGCYAGEELPVDNSLLLPTQLPEGVCLSLTNYSPAAPGTLWYQNKQGSKVLLISFLKQRHFLLPHRRAHLFNWPTWSGTST